mgnify:CR=1 FL=1
MKVFFTKNITLKYFLCGFFFIISINPIISEEIYNEKRKNQAIQIVKMVIGQGFRVKVINSDYIPKRVYVNNEPVKIDSTGFVDIIDEERPLNYITMEWDEKASKYSKLFQNIDSVIEIDLSQFETAKQKAVRSLDKENIYIIDTNVFVEEPNIINKINDKYRVALSAKVIDEQIGRAHV